MIIDYEKILNTNTGLLNYHEDNSVIIKKD